MDSSLPEADVKATKTLHFLLYTRSIFAMRSDLRETFSKRSFNFEKVAY